MKKYIFFVGIFSFINSLQAQKIYILPGFNLNYANLVVAPQKMPDVTTPFPGKHISLFFEVFYKPKYTFFSLGVKSSNIGNSFTVRNNYVSDTSLGVLLYSTNYDIEQFNVTLSINKFSKKFKPFIGAHTLKFNLKTGIGIGFNRSQYYYDEQFFLQNGGAADQYSFVGFESKIKKKYTGYFLATALGAELYSKKKRKLIVAELYYDFGLRKMAEFSSLIVYGKYLYPTQNIDPLNSKRIENFKTFTRGSTFGLKIGVPITIKK